MPEREVRDRYEDALRSFVHSRSEQALSRAYELGRAAAASGVGVIELASAHEELVASLAAASPAPHEVVARAAEFLCETLSPFEMTYRGYRELNVELNALNAELRRQTSSLEQVNAELEAFGYSVSHDLRAPLRALDGFSEALQTAAADQLDAECRGYLARIRQSATFMQQLIDGLLALAQVTRAPLERREVDLSALVEETAARLRGADPARRVTVEVQPGLRCVGDGRLWATALENLLGNAWKFSRGREDARITFGHADGAYFVRDNGVGFEMSHAGRLFGAFQRLHAKSEFEGHGIGLATVQRIVRRHGGRIWAESHAGAGTTFFFTIGDQAVSS